MKITVKFIILIFTISFIGNIYLLWKLRERRKPSRENISIEEIYKNISINQSLIEKSSSEKSDLYIFTAIPAYSGKYPNRGKMFQRQLRMNKTENNFNQIFLDTNGQRLGPELQKNLWPIILYDIKARLREPHRAFISFFHPFFHPYNSISG